MGNCCGLSDKDILRCMEEMDNSTLDLARALDKLKGMIDFLVNVQDELDHNAFKRVYKYTTDLQKLIQEEVMIQKRNAMSCFCNILKITQKKIKKIKNKEWKTNAYLEEELSLINDNSDNLQSLKREDNKINKKETSNLIDKTGGECSTPMESTPLLSKSDSHGYENFRGSEDNTIVKEADLNDKNVTDVRRTITSPICQSADVEQKNTCEELSREICELKSNKMMLLQRLTSLQQTVDLIDQSLQEKNEKCLILQKEVNILNEEKHNYDSTIRSLEEKLAHTQAQLQDETTKSERREITVLNLRSDLEDKDVQLQNVSLSLGHMQKEKLIVDEQNKELQLTIVKAKEDLLAIKEKLERERYEREQIEIKLKTTNLNLEEKETHLQESNVLLEALNNDKIKYETTTKDLLQRIASLEEANELLTSTLTEKKLLQVQVYCPSKSEMMAEVQNEMMRLIQEKLENRTSEFKFVKCTNIADVIQSLPTLLLCINTSRLGTDVSTILQKFQSNSKMAVIVFHHKDAHALPNESSSRVLVGQEFKQLGGIFDMAFLTGKGIYSCTMNEDNISKLISFIVKLL